MKGKIVRRVFSLCCVAIFVLLLTGCEPTAGATVYEVIYPSGYTRDYVTRDKKIPIEGTSYYLQWEEADDYKETYDYDLQILDENEFYITSNGTRCYFYSPGKEESEKLFGLIKVPAKNAVIYYREISDWTQKHTVYPFDYVEEPDIDTSKGVETCIKFYIFEEQVKVVWTSYESIGNGDWEYLEKMVYEIPLTEDAV